MGRRKRSGSRPLRFLLPISYGFSKSADRFQAFDQQARSLLSTNALRELFVIEAHALHARSDKFMLRCATGQPG
jgi:hypothetical protein